MRTNGFSFTNGQGRSCTKVKFTPWMPAAKSKNRLILKWVHKLAFGMMLDLRNEIMSGQSEMSMGVIVAIWIYFDPLK